MAWQVLKIHPSPLQSAVTLKNDDTAATATTDYHKADALARQTLGAACLAWRGDNGSAVRHYVSQAY